MIILMYCWLWHFNFILHLLSHVIFYLFYYLATLATTSINACPWYAQPQSGEAPSGERLRGKGRHWCNCTVKLCDPCLSALRVIQNQRYINTLTFTFYLFTSAAYVWTRTHHDRQRRTYTYVDYDVVRRVAIGVNFVQIVGGGLMALSFPSPPLPSPLFPPLPSLSSPSLSSLPLSSPPLLSPLLRSRAPKSS